MKIGGIQKFSLIDYPKKVSAIIFTQGCNMFCPYCHNPQLVYPSQYEEIIDEKMVFDFLNKRKGQIEGIVITGGEPLIHNDLEEFIKKIKNLGYLIKLDTNGSLPNVLENLISQVDFVAMDIKAPFEKYNLFFDGDVNLIKQSISIIKSSGKPHLFRTTYDKTLLTDNDIKTIKDIVCTSEFIVQECIS